MTIAASDFEDWRRANPDADYRTFKFNLKKMSVSGALFDENKLNDVSKMKIAAMKSDEVYDKLTAWAKEFDIEFINCLLKTPHFQKLCLQSTAMMLKNRVKIWRIGMRQKNILHISLIHFIHLAILYPSISALLMQRLFLLNIKIRM